MGSSICSCNNKLDQGNEVNMPSKNAATTNFNLSKLDDSGMPTATDRFYAKGGNINNLSLEDKFAVAKVIRLQIRIKNFLKRIKPNILKEAENLQYAVADKSAPTTEGFTGLEKKANFSSNQNFEYKGGRLNGEKDGFGVQKWKDGAVYLGLFKSNRANGLGIFKHSDGDEYKGEFINDRACGYGLYRHSNGATYEGYWLDDCQNGIGQEKWSDNSEYEGYYVKGKKQGLGTYIWSDKSRYEGEWYENCLHGYGIYYFNDSRIYIGQWQYNTMHGYGEFRWKDGKRYLGYYTHDKKEGFGIYYWASPNRVYIGFWKAGKQDGVGKYINPKTVRFGVWKNGEREKWFSSEKEAMEHLENSQLKFKNLFKYDLKDITMFMG